MLSNLRIFSNLESDALKPKISNLRLEYRFEIRNSVRIFEIPENFLKGSVCVKLCKFYNRVYDHYICKPSLIRVFFTLACPAFFFQNSFAIFITTPNNFCLFFIIKHMQKFIQISKRNAFTFRQIHWPSFWPLPIHC